jgi:hypothetical protein
MVHLKDKSRVNNIIVIDRLKKLIDTQTREEIAAGIGCETSLVTKHYNEDRKVTIEQLAQYCDYFKVSADYLLGKTPDPTTDPDVKKLCKYTGLTKDNINMFHCCIGSGTPRERTDAAFCACMSEIINRFFASKDFMAGIERYNDFLLSLRGIQKEVDAWLNDAPNYQSILLLGDEIRKARMERFEAIDYLTDALTNPEKYFDDLLDTYKALKQAYLERGTAGETNGEN